VGDIPDNFQITRFTLCRTIEVDDVDAGRAHRLPFQRHIQRVVRELYFAFIIALIETDTFAALEVNGRNDFYDGLLLSYQLSAVRFQLLN
jgi:hypothetical protein